jgi:ubiquinone/menaquinone biosynthesis C-methylase UbiE
MDYDQTELSTNYDRSRGLSHGALHMWLDRLTCTADGSRGDHHLGCGTGRFSAGLAAAVATRVIGIDPSERCSPTRAKRFRQCRAEKGVKTMSWHKGSLDAAST